MVLARLFSLREFENFTFSTKKPINQKFSSTDAYETAPVMGLDHFENFLKCFEISPSIITVMPHFKYTK